MHCMCMIKNILNCNALLTDKSMMCSNSNFLVIAADLLNVDLTDAISLAMAHQTHKKRFRLSPKVGHSTLVYAKMQDRGYKKIYMASMFYNDNLYRQGWPIAKHFCDDRVRWKQHLDAINLKTSCKRWIMWRSVIGRKTK